MRDDKTIIASDPSETTATTSHRGAPVLLQYDAGAAGKRFLLVETKNTIGRRADKVQVWIDDVSVSREHCEIVMVGTKAFVTDLGSLNGTYINDQVVQQNAELRHSDMLRVGNVRLRYFAHGSADQLLFDRIYRMAVQDKMLDVFRKDYVLEKLEEDVRVSRGNLTPLSLIMFDLDKFKLINDTFGHDAGDYVLKQVCSQVRPLLRSTDTFGRFGGEEFMIILPQTNAVEAFKMAEDIRKTIEAHSIEYEGVHIPVTLSLGVSTLTEEISNSQDFIKAADNNVYKSKKSGRNKVSQ